MYNIVGLGIDCPDVRHVYHVAPPDDTESYIQESGRCGRDGLLSYATLLLKKRIPRTLEMSMHEYISNTLRCRKDVLFGGFENYEHIDVNCKCICCDICIKDCRCSKCNNN